MSFKWRGKHHKPKVYYKSLFFLRCLGKLCVSGHWPGVVYYDEANDLIDDIMTDQKINTELQRELDCSEAMVKALHQEIEDLHQDIKNHRLSMKTIAKNQ